MSFDTIIRNGRWFDGTGAPSAVRDIGIADGRVTAVAVGGQLEAGTGTRVIDATGKWVLPGMIDIHTHYDVEVLVAPALAESLVSDVGIRVAPDLYTDSLGDADSGADTYIGLMQTDTLIIVENLRA